MNYTFRPAVSEPMGLILSLAGPSGSGKTLSAMKIARGISGDKRFAVIDTENRRSRHYLKSNHFPDGFEFDVLDLVPPFRPSKYSDAVKAAIEQNYPVISNE